MKLHLGAGKKLLDGWENIDAPGSGAPVEMDIRKLAYADDSAEEIMAIHVWEHMPLAECGVIMAEWFRVLAPGGRMVLELPCRDKVFAAIRAGVENDAVMFAFYGDPSTHRSTDDVHRWLWSKGELAMLMADVGLVDIVSEKPHYHVPVRDMRLVGTKPRRIVVAS